MPLVSSTLSETAVANMAATVLDEAHIASLSDTTTIARFVKAELGHARDEVLQMHPWYFAEDYARLASDPTAVPTSRWTYRYRVPGDCLRVKPLTECGQHNGKLIPYERKRTFIYTNAKAPLDITYTVRVDNLSEWPPLVARVLGSYVGVLGAMRITGKANYLDKAQNAFRQAMMAAQSWDALDRGTIEDYGFNGETDTVLTARGVY